MFKENSSLSKQKRLIISADPFYNSLWISKLINKFMRHGKKFAIENSLQEAFSRFKITNYPKQPLPLLFRHLLVHRPLFTMTNVRRGKEKKEVPIPLTSRRQLVLIMSWYTLSIKSYGKKYLSEKIYADLKAIKSNHKTALMRYKKFTSCNFRLVVNRFNHRFRWK